MKRGTLSIYGLYTADQTLFDEMIVPDGISKEQLCNNILVELAELETLYSNPEFMKHAIGNWSNIYAPVWAELYKTLQYNYNPIDNYDRTEERTLKEERNLKNTNIAKTTDEGKTDNNGTITGTQKVAAFNSEEAQTRDINTEERDLHQTINNTNNIDASGTDTGTVKHTETTHVRGNIGVTTTQQMIEAQRRVVQFNIIDYITDQFKQRFCLLVY